MKKEKHMKEKDSYNYKSLLKFNTQRGKMIVYPLGIKPVSKTSNYCWIVGVLTYKESLSWCKPGFLKEKRP